MRIKRLELEEALGDEFISELNRLEGHKIVCVFREDPEDIEKGALVEDLNIHENLKQILKRRGIERLYKFQEEAVKSIKNGEHTVIVAGTGLGKTEAFLIPILDDIIRDPFRGVRALLIYPTKALARDQFKRIKALTSAVFGARAAIYDGDTPEKERKLIFSMPPPILITNPDMIHMSLMYSREFQQLISTVKYIVLDDMHVYNGVFGTHVSYVLRRLERFLSEDPIYIGTSATIGNPGEFAKQLIRREVKVIQASGGRKGRIYHIFLRPTSRSKLVEAVLLARLYAKKGLKTVIFADSHKVVELIRRLGLRYTLDILVHRAGLRPEERRKVEDALKSGKASVVAATPTLELGIDIGDLDGVILVNIPPTYSKYVQRTGRCGRSGQTAYVTLILGNDPISLYYENYPEEFFAQGYDPLMIDTSNEEIGKVHLLAMARDQPFTLSELTPFEKELVSKLIAEKLLKLRGRYVTITRKGLHYLSKRLSLRGVGEQVKIVSVNGRVIGFREMPMALKELFPGAIYLHGGDVYVSVEFKPPVAVVRKMPPDFDLLTTPLYLSEPSNFQTLLSRDIMGVKVEYGKFTVRDVVYGYVIKDFKTGSILRENILDQEYSYTFQTKGILIHFPAPADWKMMECAEAFHAIEHVLISAGETLVGAAPTDMGGISFPTGHIFIYDAFPGGSGVTLLLFRKLEKAIMRALRILEKCDCVDGCPKCIFSPYCGNNNKILSRRRALRYLKDFVEGKRENMVTYSSAEGRPIV